MSIEQITSEVLRLNRVQRIELLQRVLKSMAEEEVLAEETGLTEEQAKEIDRRIAEFESGKVKTIPAEEVHAKLANKYGLQF